MEFPYNLLNDIGLQIEELPKDFYPTYHYITDVAITEREKEILELRYSTGASLEYIGQRVDLSKQRISIILTSVLNKISKQPYRDMFTYGIEEFTQHSFDNRIAEIKDDLKEEARVELAMEEYDKGYKKGREDALVGKEENKTNMDAVRSIRTATLPMSVRLSNCFARNNIFTLGDVIDLADDIQNIQNFGKNCFWEVLRFLRKYNVDVVSIFPRTIMKYGVGM